MGPPTHGGREGSCLWQGLGSAPESAHTAASVRVAGQPGHPGLGGGAQSCLALASKPPGSAGPQYSSRSLAPSPSLLGTKAAADLPQRGAFCCCRRSLWGGVTGEVRDKPDPLVLTAAKPPLELPAARHQTEPSTNITSSHFILPKPPKWEVLLSLPFYR